MKIIKKELALICLGLFVVSISFADDSRNQGGDRNHRAKLNAKDNLWGYSSNGRKIIDVVTNEGLTIKAVDVDGLAYVGDMILGHSLDLQEYGLQINAGQEAPEDLGAPSAVIRFPTSGYKWPNNVVPYVFASNLGTRSRSAMNYAINHWNSKTKVRFVARTNQSSYLLIQNSTGCSSWIGMQGGQQIVNLAEGCGNGAAVHELGHAVGFFHEQSRTDRDSYVTIYWNNIQSGMSYNFNKISTGEGQNHGKYDYYSIMHYRTTAFGINNAITIWPRLSGVDTNYMGNGSVLSSGDVSAAGAIYK